MIDEVELHMLMLFLFFLQVIDEVELHMIVSVGTQRSKTVLFRRCKP